jgi:deazaflavin-dependent oxidoreductase (nitroreductase family)
MKSLDTFANEEFCYLTTTGRVSGLPREIEIWFGVNRGTLYMLSGGRKGSNWVRNLMRKPEVSIRIAGQTFTGKARLVEEGTSEDRMARKLLVEKYQPDYGGDLTNWGRTALPVAVEFDTGHK